jgi:hypothetical protein
MTASEPNFRSRAKAPGPQFVAVGPGRWVTGVGTLHPGLDHGVAEG